jgi:transposase
LFIVATARPEFRPPWSIRSHHGTISLAPLDHSQVRDMVTELSARHALPQEVVEVVAARTGGVPLFVEEVTRLLLERGGEQGGIHAIPPTLQQSLTARLDRLGSAREVAQIGAAPRCGRYRGECVAKLSLRQRYSRDSVDQDVIRGERPMMGRRERAQGQFFYAFDLDKVVPADHLVRQIDGVLDLDWVHKDLAPYYSQTGRPSIDPVLMIRMLIVGYVFAIRSERRLCSEVQVNLAYRWFCKLGIEDGIPDHSVFSRARHERFRQSGALRWVFESVVAKCIAAGLVGGEGFSIDASLIRADVDKKKRTPGDQPISWPKAEEASRAVREYPNGVRRRPKP